jgi:hypothetical protein
LLVYRLEDAKGLGLYRGRWRIQETIEEWAYENGFGDEWNAEALEYDYGQPLPESDFVRSEWAGLSEAERSRFLFGFPDADGARAWFGPVRLRIYERFGFHVVPRKARKAYLSKSKRQLIFLPYEGD